MGVGPVGEALPPPPKPAKVGEGDALPLPLKLALPPEGEGVEVSVPPTPPPPTAAAAWNVEFTGCVATAQGCPAVKVPAIGGDAEGEREGEGLREARVGEAEAPDIGDGDTPGVAVPPPLSAALVGVPPLPPCRKKSPGEMEGEGVIEGNSGEGEKEGELEGKEEREGRLDSEGEGDSESEDEGEEEGEEEPLPALL